MEKFTITKKELNKAGKDILTLTDKYDGTEILEEVLDSFITSTYTLSKGELSHLKTKSKDIRRKYLLSKTEFVKPLNEYKDEITIFCKKYIDCDTLLCSMTILENEVSIFKKVGYKPNLFMKIFNIPENMKKDLKSSNFVANYLKFITKPMIIDYCEKNLINKNSYKIGVSDIYEKNGYINFDVHFTINLKELDSQKLLDVELAIAELNEIVGEDVLKKE